MKKLLLLAAALVMSVGAWAQTLPIESGVYEIQNVSGEGSSSGRGYLVDYTGWTTGPSIAQCPWSSWTSSHPAQKNSDSTCSYWYLQQEEDGTYSLFSLSTLGNPTTPKYLKVGATKSAKCTWSDEKVKLDIVASTRTGNSKENAVIIRNHEGSFYLSMGCGTNSNQGSVVSENTLTDGGLPLYFGVPTETFVPTEAQLALFEAAGVEYSSSHTAAEIAELQAQFEAACTPINGKKVGYPALDSPAAVALLAFDHVTGANYDQVVAAIAALKDETKVNLPVAGKSYYIRPFYKENTYGYLYDNGTKLTSKMDKPETGAVFVPTKVNNNTMALKIAGTDKYLRWTSGDNQSKSNPVTGYSEYNETYSTQTILKAVVTRENDAPHTQVTGITNADLYGLLEINGKGTNNQNYFLVNRADGAFVAGDHDDKYYDNTAAGRTVYYAFEEVESQGGYTLHVGQTGYASMYLAKNVTIPEGVKVFYCPEEWEDYVLKTVEISKDQVLPSYTAYIIEAPADQDYFFPYTEAEGGDFVNVEGLWGCASKAMNREELHDLCHTDFGLDITNFYVLSVVNDKVGFYRYIGNEFALNKAFYFHPTSVANETQGFVLDFGGQTTGVDNVTTTTQSAASYDLQGRRVSKATRGLFIQNGVKVIR